MHSLRSMQSNHIYATRLMCMRIRVCMLHVACRGRVAQLQGAFVVLLLLLSLDFLVGGKLGAALKSHIRQVQMLSVLACPHCDRLNDGRCCMPPHVHATSIKWVTCNKYNHFGGDLAGFDFYIPIRQIFIHHSLLLLTNVRPAYVCMYIVVVKFSYL